MSKEEFEISWNHVASQDSEDKILEAFKILLGE